MVDIPVHCQLAMSPLIFDCETPHHFATHFIPPLTTIHDISANQYIILIALQSLSNQRFGLNMVMINTNDSNFFAKIFQPALWL